MIGDRKIKVLIIDQSKQIRQTLERILLSDDMITTIVEASEPFIAEIRIKAQLPDVVIMDVEMPRLDGVLFLRKLLEYYSVPVIVCSRVINNNFETRYKNFNQGELRVIQKPEIYVRQFLEGRKTEICTIVKETVGF
jgi:two-component system, chemotaxis family, protein-glutamate methylesterase/glutaminase